MVVEEFICSVAALRSTDKDEDNLSFEIFFFLSQYDLMLLGKEFYWLGIK